MRRWTEWTEGRTEGVLLPLLCAATLLLLLQQLLLFVIACRMVKMVPGIWYLVEYQVPVSNIWNEDIIWNFDIIMFLSQL